MGFSGPWPFVVAAIGGYILGAIPFGLLLTRIAGLGDIRSMGSGNIGATNVLRTGRKRIAAATLLLDAGKGALAVAIATRLGGLDAAVFAAGGAVIGHIAPVWLGFRGGKGVATALGVLLAIAWPVGVIAMAVWLAIALLLRYSSVAALAAMVAAPFAAWAWTGPEVTALAAFVAIIVILRHANNIRRLIRGEEPRIRLGGARAVPQKSAD